MGGNKRKPPAAKNAGGGGKASWWSSSNLLFALAAVLVAGAVPMLLPYLSAAAPREPQTPLRDAGRSGGKGAAAPRAASCDADAEEDIMCAPWHKAGLCRRPEVARACARTCGQCPSVPGRVPRVTREDRCRRDNLTAAVPAGQLTPLFERILRDYPQYEPEALSTEPYVLLLKNFVTADESAAFLRVCKESFERSLAGDQLNPVRTSFQCWCNFAGCFTDPLVHKVTNRINQLLGIPYNNGEDLQIVRYEPGQFYRRHHDQNTAVWAPQGPRVLTFFMYLNDPAAGGETAFPLVGPPPGLRVSPKLGHAILWPSTLDTKPMSSDMRTDHEAMPVHEGIKYAANMWVHQFDFKTPSERGCELTYVNTMGGRPSTAEHQALVGGGRVPTAEETVRMAAMRPSEAS